MGVEINFSITSAAAAAAIAIIRSSEVQKGGWGEGGDRKGDLFTRKTATSTITQFTPPITGCGDVARSLSKLTLILTKNHTDVRYVHQSLAHGCS